MAAPTPAGEPAPAELTLGARQLLARAGDGPGGTAPGVREWLIALLERNGPLAESTVPGLDAVAFLAEIRAGHPSTGAEIPGRAGLLARAGAHAASRGKAAVSEFDIAAVLLTAAGRSVVEPAEIGRLRRASSPVAVAPAGPPGAPDSAPRPVEWHPIASRPTPVLDQYGRDLTRQAAEGQLGPVVGREKECGQVVETLCRRQKRNPVLLGEAGTGKTAIVEGLAGLIVAGRVAPTLQGVRIIQLQPSSLVAGASMVGELENRMKAILEEARQVGIILFFDEVHSIVGTGGMRGTGDLASLLKPALARGEIACIAATTDDEYRRFIADDAALERRFNPVPVAELDRASSVGVLRAHRDALERLRGVRVSDDLLDWLVGFSIEAMPNRRLPDKAVDLLEQCVAHAVVQGVPIVDRPTAEEVVRRMVGVPESIDDRVAALERELGSRGLSNPAATRTLMDRLHVTLRGFDSHRQRANAVLLVTGAATSRARDLAEVVATSLFGGADRLVEIDFGRMTNPQDVSMLVGAPPGYIGYSDRLPIHRLQAMPWSVLLCEGVDGAHPQVRELLAEALEDGAFVDGAGRRIPLSDAVVVMVGGAGETAHALGFRAPGAGPERATVDPVDTSRTAQRIVGDRLAHLIDVVVTEHTAATGAEGGVARVLARVADRFGTEGTKVRWDASVGPWLAALGERFGDLDAAVDRELLPRLIPLLAQAARGPHAFVVSARPDGEIVVAQDDRPVEVAVVGPGQSAAAS